MSTYETKGRLVKGVAAVIVEKNDRGDIIGAYKGYWNPGRRAVVLYPDYRHPALKPGVKLVKREVYDGLVKCKMQNAECKINGAEDRPDKRQSSRDVGVPNSTRQIRNLPIMGQTRMKF